MSKSTIIDACISLIAPLQLYIIQTRHFLTVTPKINHSPTQLDPHKNNKQTVRNKDTIKLDSSTKDVYPFFIRKCLRNQHLETLQKRHDHFCESSRGKSGVTTTWTQISIVTDGCIGRGGLVVRVVD